MKHEKSAPAGYRPRFAGTMKLYLVRHKEYGELTVNGVNKYEAVHAAARKWGVRWTAIARECEYIYGCCGIPGGVCEFEGSCDKDEKTGTCKPEGVAVELCDAIIRILDYLAYMGVDVEAVLMAKHEYNKGREYRHGGKRA